MRKIEIGARTYYWPASYNDLYQEVSDLLDIEERRIIEASRHLRKPEEHLLIHLCRMYLYRFALPAVEIEEGSLTRVDLTRVQERLWLCFYGRALDDIVDGDSKFFSPADSAILLSVYAPLLYQANVGPLWNEILASSAIAMEPSVPNQSPITSSVLPFVRDDVCRRVEYYLVPTRARIPERMPLLRAYIGFLLGGCDLDDSIADATGRAATLMSLNLYHSLADDEAKVRLDSRLIAWHRETVRLLMDDGVEIREALLQKGMDYSVSVVDDELLRLQKECPGLC